MRYPIFALLLAAACSDRTIESRQYENLGRLKEVKLYADPLQLSEECVKRTGGVDDHGKPFSGTNACTDEAAGVVRISETATLRDFLHELCHVENQAARAFCDRVFPGGAIA